MQASRRTDDPLADLAHLGRAFRQFALERPHLYRITFDRVGSDIYAQPEATPALMRSYGALESFVERARSAGLARHLTSAEIAFMFHSICCGLASNFLVTLEDAAEVLLRTAGADRRILVPLARAALENWASMGGPAALTGPIVRGDEATVERQRAAIADRAPGLLAMFDALCDRTRDIAGWDEGSDA